MTRRWQLGWLVLGGLLAWGAIPQQAPAQFPSVGGPGDPIPVGPSAVPSGMPPGPISAQFGPGPGVGPGGPIGQEPANPFFLNTGSVPGAFDDEEDTRFPTPNSYSIVARFEALYYKVARAKQPSVLVTTSSGPDLTDNFGAIGQSNTQVVFGVGDYNYGASPGGRATLGLGFWVLPPIEITGSWLNDSKTLFAENSGQPGSRLLARPVNASQLNNPLGTGQESIFLVGFAPSFQGTITVDAKMNYWTVDSNLFVPLGASDSLIVSGFVGYRHVDLGESLTIQNSLQATDPNFVIPFNGVQAGFGPGNQSTVTDIFRTRNKFNGGQFGVRSILNFWRMNLITDAKLALGTTEEILYVDGYSSLRENTFPFRGETVVPGGVLALPSNMGEYKQNSFAYMPELNINLGFQVTRNIRIFGGYNLFYLSNVVRPGDHVNNIIDTRQAPTDFQYVAGTQTNSPAIVFRHADFWGYGYNFGVEISY